VVKICDFGSAKRLSAHEPNIAYICSRYYRAPELIMGVTNYTVAIDVWSVGCCVGEFIYLRCGFGVSAHYLSAAMIFRNEPMFQGISRYDQVDGTRFQPFNKIYFHLIFSL